MNFRGDFRQNRIKDLKVDSNLTQKEVTYAIDITQRKYSYIETGQQAATDEILVKLAKFYSTSVDYILKLTNHPKPYQ